MAEFFLNRLTRDGERWSAFLHDMRAEGWGVVTTWVAVPYDGPPRELPYELRIKTGLFGYAAIAAGDEESRLRDVARYVEHSSSVGKVRLAIRRSRLVLCEGDYAIVERSALEGPDRGALAEAIRRYGGTQADVDEMINRVEEKVLCYCVGWKDDVVQPFLDAVHIGATRPVSQEELARAVDGWAKAQRADVEAGNTSSKGVADALEKLAATLKARSR